MPPRMKNISRSKAMRMLFTYKNKAKRRYEGWKADDAELEYLLLRDIYIKLKKLRFRMRTLKGWLKKSLVSLENFIRDMINKSEKYRLILRTTHKKIAEVRYLGLRAATSKCVLVYDCFRKEAERFFSENI